MQLKIRSKMLMSFMAMVALIIALIVFALLSIRIMVNGNRQLVYVQKKEGLISDLQITVDRAVTALGNYLISGKEASRATFIQLVLFSRRQVESLEESITKASSGGGEIGALEAKKIGELKVELDAIDRNSREILALADKIEKGHGHKIIQDVVQAVREAVGRKKNAAATGRPPGDLRSLGDLLGVSTRDAQERIEEIEVLSKMISESESRLRELSLGLIQAKDRALEKIAELRELAQQEGILAVEMASIADRMSRKFMLVGAVITLVCGVGLALYLSRSFSKPILELERGARLIGEGGFDHRIGLETGDELEALAAGFNTMAEKLKAFYAELEKRVRERTRELEQSNQQLRRLFNGITDGISVIDREFRIVNANTGIAAMVGRREGDLVGSLCHEAYHGSGVPCQGCPASDTFTNGGSSSAQLRWCIPGQKAREVQIFTFPLLEEEGRVMHVIEYAKDVSDTKALERTLFQSAKLAGIGTLAAGVAHEIRNPLGIMKTSADMIKRSSREGEQNHELAQFMMEEIDRLNRVVTRLLDFARPSTPKMEPCDVHDVMERALALVGPQHRLQDLEITREYASDLPRILGDREQLCQVFLNLIINAAQAMLGKGRLALAVSREGEDSVSASVSDTGPGIDAAILDNIFDPFFTTKEGGSGLGLAIVYRIVEAHKGRVAVKSTPGKGTTFTVVLPTA
jgi:signal transduction histidine kinase/HAMP domain-containing protein